jgi:hypothetical protein
MLATPQLETIASPKPFIRSTKFALVLPVGELLLCAALLWPIRLLVLHALHIPIPPIVERTMLADCVRWSPKRGFFLDSIIMLNIPAGLIQLPYAIKNPTKQEWMPEGIDGGIWRAITWPFLCIPFWWIAGRAVDALKALSQRLLSPRISLMETVIGSFWLASGMLLFISFLIMAGVKKDANLTRIAAAGGLWICLGALPVVARVSQRRLFEKQNTGAKVGL